MKAEKQVKRRPGRPLSFNRDAVLKKAMIQFWRTGYETTSIAELTQTMGITAPSLYAMFGDKEHLFLEAVKLYNTTGGVTAVEMIENAQDARAAAFSLMKGSAVFFTQAGMPPGCLLASAASTGSEAAGGVRRALGTIRRELSSALQKKIERDRKRGKLPDTADAKALAGMTVALIQGMSTLARDGCSRRDLLRVAEASLVAWDARAPQQARCAPTGD